MFVPNFMLFPKFAQWFHHIAVLLFFHMVAIICIFRYLLAIFTSYSETVHHFNCCHAFLQLPVSLNVLKEVHVRGQTNVLAQMALTETRARMVCSFNLFNSKSRKENGFEEG